MSPSAFKPVAIVGMALRGPGEASDPEKFWQMLVEGRSARSEVPKDRYNVDGFYHPDPERLGSMQVRHGHFLGDFKSFDAPFFSVTASEAKSIAPTHRMLMEVAYEAFENSGISMDQVNGSNTSCYMGTSLDDFAHSQVRDDIGPSMYYASGRSNSQASNRISWFFNLKGPSMTIDTACSSSLSAFHLGCQSIQSGESRLSVVGGANLILGPDVSLLYGAARVLSPEGKCKMWDVGANGFGRGEGAGVVVLKSLDDALEDGDTIRAVVLASVAQEDGRTPGIMLPSSEAQRDMIRNAYAVAGVDPAETGYFEAHGTGTQAGDPLEARALMQTVGGAPNRTTDLYVGTVKTNIGHLEGAAGALGVIKAALAVERGLIPPNLWFEELNPAITLNEYVKVPTKLKKWPHKGPRRASVNSFGFGGANAHVILEDAAAYLARLGREGNHVTFDGDKSIPPGLLNGNIKSKSYEVTNGHSASANGANGTHHVNGTKGVNGVNGVNGTNGINKTNGVNGINGTSAVNGASGVNGANGIKKTNGANGANGATAHDEHLEKAQQRLFVFSSHDKDGVARSAKALGSYLESKASIPGASRLDEEFMERLAHTLSMKRSVHVWKTFAIASTTEELRHSLNQMSAPVRSSSPSTSPSSANTGAGPKVAFVFTGQGAQWFAMGRSLVCFDVFRKSIARSAKVLRAIGCPWHLEEELFDRSEKGSNLGRAEYSMPSCTALQIALVDLVESWGVRPVAVVGHSSGEMAAAYCAGLISHEAAMKVASMRGRGSTSIVERVGSGGMLAVSASADTVMPRLERLTRGRAVVGCFNSPGACTISGDKGAIDELQDILQHEGVSCTRLPVDVAYHSFHTESASIQYGKDIADVPHVPRREPVPMFSSVTGKPVTAAQMRPAYWVENFIQPVNFNGAVFSLLNFLGAEETSVLLEIGPHSALRSYVLEIISASKIEKQFTYASMLRRKHDAVETALLAMGQLWTRGCGGLHMDKVNQVAAPTRLLVDLPPYSWNRAPTLSFWEESRLGREYRLRTSQRTDLLGLRISTAADPTWRGFLRCRESPWIREHQIHGSNLYPAAGMMVMAIEAVRDISGHLKGSIHSFELRDVSIMAALIVPDTDEGVEVQLQLHPRRVATRGAPSSTLNEFVITSWSEDAQMWTTHARGLISATYKSALSAALQQELDYERQSHQAALSSARWRCQNHVSAKNLYGQLQDIGMHYGPTFRNLDRVFASSASSFGSISVPDTKRTMPHAFEFPHVIHPVTLDSALHLVFPSISSATSNAPLTEALVPTLVEKMTIFNVQNVDTVGKSLHGTCTSEKSSFVNWTSSIIVTTSNNADSSVEEAIPFIVIEGLRLSPAGASGSTDVSNSNDNSQPAGCFEEAWHAAVDFLDPGHALELVYERAAKEDEEDQYDVLDYMCLVYIRQILPLLEGYTREEKDGHLFHYLEWMRDVVARSHPLLKREGEPPLAGKDTPRKLAEALQAASRFKGGGIAAQMITRIGEALLGIFGHGTTPRIEPLQVMTEGGLLYEVYRHALGQSYNNNVAEYLGLLADTRPGELRILEIGAGTGGTTYNALERLRGPGVGRYVFTDISPGFLSTAQERFAQDSAAMEFVTLDIEKDPLQQGFRPDSFDVIVASNVLHATASIQKTLTHCRALLRPGGKLVLAEVTIPRIFVGFIYGTLSGWWLGEEDGRNGGPLLSVPEWDTALRKAEFTGVDLDARGDGAQSLEPISLIVSTKQEPVDVSRSLFQTPSTTIIHTGTPTSIQLSQLLVPILLSQGVPEVSAVAWRDLLPGQDQHVKGRYCISLVEWESVLLADTSLTDADWEILQYVVLHSAGTLWVTGGVSLETCPDGQPPYSSLMVGLARAIRNENPDLVLATVDVDVAFMEPLAQDKLAQSLARIGLAQSRGTSSETELALRLNGNGPHATVFVPRIRRSPTVDASLQLLSSASGAVVKPEEVSFGKCRRALKLSIQTPGLLDTFRWVEDETYRTPLPEDWIEIRVKAVGLNFKDVLIAMGNINQSQLGLDTAGVVSRVGASVTGFIPGDHVMAATTDAFATFVRFPARLAAKIPPTTTFEEAASMPVVYLTAYHSLVTTGNLQRGESVLIHAAAGGVGQAAIAVAQQIGAEIFATVGTEEKQRLLIEEYGIPEDHIFSSRDISFARGVMRMTSGKGVDVVLNCLAGEALRASWHCLASWGRFLEIGNTDILANTGLDMSPFLDNKSYFGINLSDFMNNPAPRVAACWDAVASLVSSGVAQAPKPIRVFGVSEVEQAFRYMQAGKHMGKVVVRFSQLDDDTVLAVPSAPRAAVKDNVIYVLAGLGGLCREIGRWLAEKGARNLLLLSRTAASGVANIEYAAMLRKAYGVNVLAYDCDVGDREALRDILTKSSELLLAPIRGCITGAMALEDTPFAAMTASQVRKAVWPKVHGTVNLHELLPKDLDFFVMLSSIAGVIGNREQGNYGCGNIFQDRFADFRRSQGLRAMTINVSYLTSVGFVAEHYQYVNYFRAMGLHAMQTRDLHSLLSIAIQDDATDYHPGQIICGLTPLSSSDQDDGRRYWMHEDRFIALRNTGKGASGEGADKGGSSSAVSLAEELRRCGADNAAAATDIVTAALVQRLARLMMMPAEDIDPGRPLNAYGVDSLVAVEVRNWIKREMAVDVSVFEVMASVPMHRLASGLVGKRGKN